MRFIIFDLEATCVEDKNKKFDNETIEFGAVKIENKSIIDTLQLFVKPKLNPTLTSFCTKLTSITQTDINNAKSFPLSLPLFLDWCYKGSDDVLFCSWGFYDRHQLEKDCKRFGLNYDFISNHISLKHQFHNVYTEHNIPNNGVGMETALRMLKLPLDGTHHRGIDDAKNIAKIFLKFYDYWQY